MEIRSKKTLAIFSLTSCGGCFDVVKDRPEEYFALQKFYTVDDLRPKHKNTIDKKYDIVIIEGHPRGKSGAERAKTIRRNAKIVVAIGACAHLGGVYQMGTLLPKEKRPHLILSKIIRIDYLVPGCPVNSDELIRCLIDLYWGRIFRLPDLSICFECRQNENNCLLKKNKLCLGPITRAGCGSICINNGEACLGCRGSKPDANIEKMTEILKPIVIKDEIDTVLTMYGGLDVK
ncbi:hypothetical protein COT78_00885 [Candidatus Berkelbacteria bacterium CG10_big_fil_rev_8_21_14_0_10_43_13]|uniref:NADH:ubiquinone oxidoreductase-like 20kDa subunit domain-containing protein n=1 Tax=Candidatus Berkelbacteria bacterium CG10_big_fil_rev_8_21_14_0_10_43_13 TaxID=1974514 RepID=A0A2H0W779_9BACT|nr:MAG: hypothetical protein COT78_00885 [Candidatus Berkelbacteria bacterium CG10_big_fil_rev_8_21_14_0_10_43_13]